MEGRPRDRDRGERRAMVGADGLDDLVVVEQAVELLELGLEAEAELGDEGEQIGPVIDSEHGCGVPSVRLVRCLPTAYKPPGKQGNFAPQTSTSVARLPSISMRRLPLARST